MAENMQCMVKATLPILVPTNPKETMDSSCKSQSAACHRFSVTFQLNANN